MSTDTVFSELHYPSIATSRLEEETERARVRGHAAGYAEGLRAAESAAQASAERARVDREAMHDGATAALTAAVDALRTAATRFEAASVPVLEAADEAMLAAAIELAEAIIGHELDDERSSARTAISRALSSIHEESISVESISVVRVSPVDLAVFGAHGITAPELRFVADPTLSPGDAIVEFGEGRVDASIHSALERARAELKVTR